jgi:hypothetical protein
VSPSSGVVPIEYSTEGNRWPTKVVELIIRTEEDRTDAFSRLGHKRKTLSRNHDRYSSMGLTVNDDVTIMFYEIVFVCVS